MIVRILVWLFIFLLIALGISWALGGGPQRAFSSARGIQNPLEFFMGKDSGGGPVTLPWQPTIPQGPDIGISDSGGDSYANPYTSVDDTGNAQTYDAREFGDPSPYVGRVNITGGRSEERRVGKECRL